MSEATATVDEPVTEAANEGEQAQKESNADTNTQQEQPKVQDEVVPALNGEAAVTDASNTEATEKDTSEQVAESGEQSNEQTQGTAEEQVQDKDNEPVQEEAQPLKDEDEQITEPTQDSGATSEPIESECGATQQDGDDNSKQVQEDSASTENVAGEQSNTETSGNVEEQALPEVNEQRTESQAEESVPPQLGDSLQQGGEGTSEEQADLEQQFGELDVQRPVSTVPVLEDIVEEEEEELVEVDREELLAETKEALQEQERLQALNAQLQHKIAEYLARKKTEERADPGRTVTDQEKRYNKLMAALERHKMELGEIQQEFEYKVEESKGDNQVKKHQVKQARMEFNEYRKEWALTAVHSRTGKRLTNQEVDQYQAAEKKKEKELKKVRRENIKLQNKIAKQESQIKQKEQLAEGLHMIDFEQLKINNVDLNEKIEERNEDTLRLRKKVTSTVQVLTHVKEKLQFLQAENAEKRSGLDEMEALVAKKRDHLTRMKQVRDALRMDNIRLKQKGGLVGHSALLRDFEERRDQNEDMKEKLDQLQKRHSELTVVCDGLRKKIEHTRTMTSHF